MNEKEINDIAAKVMKDLGFPADIVDKVRKDVESEQSFDEEKAKLKELLVDKLGLCTEEEFKKADEEANKKISGFQKFIETMSEAQGKSSDQLKKEINEWPLNKKEDCLNLAKLYTEFTIQLMPEVIVPNGLTKGFKSALDGKKVVVEVVESNVYDNPFDKITLRIVKE